jgi:hypothetical protein
MGLQNGGATGHSGSLGGIYGLEKDFFSVHSTVEAIQLCHQDVSQGQSFLH